MPARTAASIDATEIARFEAVADRWWDSEGEFRPLHRLNPVRVGFIRDRLCADFDRSPTDPKPLAGLAIADIGCGGGLLCEPMARLGAETTGIDAGAEAVAVARLHAGQAGLTIDYREATAEALAAEGRQFDAVLALEIVEHVADVDAFLGAVAALVRPGGTLIMSTLNRTPKSFGLAILGAEYVLRWVPRGTHDWRKFVRPSELAGGLRRHGIATETMSGMVYNPLAGTWRLSASDLDVNYLLAARKAGEGG
ncbi:MAG: bifunctional 2-polyprenyl-6-hydroxyphenol methylase/3-demethylubiquinol 3-O-methyltransferase UbiG [Inquilinus sp.]|nr:bifunctional 2-polyprenyl-6-hydroxyphenol methylase/3-demethylubiquinol 3-O-methyltransferase UbiG [Inquilinus sp.]